MAFDLPMCCFWNRNCRFRLLRSIVSRSIYAHRRVSHTLRTFTPAKRATHNFDVLEAREDQVLQQLAADTLRDVSHNRSEGEQRIDTAGAHHQDTRSLHLLEQFVS